MQAKTEIELLTRICEADHRDQFNISKFIGIVIVLLMGSSCCFRLT